ncbi:hypothetical protein NQ318_006924 [Aromia moschata]|uniref:Ribosomal protein L29 n=1 Tax=Aromia moschata TaxID=1265417 RepID=A0AAV8YMR0_9CUCU|nr:hypothetical protein NQ318_006924 [Aromia moschata]
MEKKFLTEVLQSEKKVFHFNTNIRNSLNKLKMQKNLKKDTLTTKKIEKIWRAKDWRCEKLIARVKPMNFMT